MIRVDQLFDITDRKSKASNQLIDKSLLILTITHDDQNEFDTYNNQNSRKKWRLLYTEQTDFCKNQTEVLAASIWSHSLIQAFRNLSGLSSICFLKKLLKCATSLNPST